MKRKIIIIGISNILVSTSMHILAAGNDVNANVSPDVETNIETTTINNSNANTFSCHGEGTTCNTSVTAVNDLKEIKILVAPHNLGKIISPRTIEMKLPDIGAQRLFTLTLTEPMSQRLLDKEFVNKPMDVLLVGVIPNEEILRGMPDAIHAVRVYRRMQSETLWTERGAIVTNYKPTGLASIIINTNGKVEYTFIEGKPQAIYLVGE